MAVLDEVLRYADVDDINVTDRMPRVSQHQAATLKFENDRDLSGVVFSDEKALGSRL